MRHARVLLALVAASSAGCFPLALSSLSDPSAAKVDARLYGKWVADSEHDRGTVVEIKKSDLPDAPVGLMTVTYSRPGAVGDVELHFFVTTVRGQTFANLVWAAPDEFLRKWDLAKIRGYMICRYTVAADRLEYTFPWDAELAERIADGRILGKVTENGGSSPREVVLKGTSDDLVGLFAGKDAAKLFPDRFASKLRRTKK